MSDGRFEDGMELIMDMVPEMVTGVGDTTATRFARELGGLSVENVFGRLWTRPGLDRRSRSLVTLGILIALRAGDELRFHFPIALRNGLTREELEEVVYHASGYAGFPAAALAAGIGHQMLDDKEPPE